MKWMTQGWESMWKRKLLEDKGGEGAGGAGGSGAGGGSSDGAAGGEGAGAGAKGSDGDSDAGAGAGADGDKGDNVSAPAKTDPAILKQIEDLQRFQSSVVKHMDQDPATGEWKPKAVAKTELPTAEEIQHAQTISEAAEQSARMIEVSRKSEEKIIEKFKAVDPLFAKNIIKARERMQSIPLNQRTETVWERAYSMEAGDLVVKGDYAKHHEDVGYKRALQELADSGRITLPEGSRGDGGAAGGSVDTSKIKLSNAQMAVANKMISGGFIKDVDEYKRNLAELDMVEA